MKDELFAELAESVREGGAILREEVPPARRFESSPAYTPDVAQLRKKNGLSQREFAGLLGISTGTLRNWEQGRRVPEGPARVLLRVVECNPQAVWNALSSGLPSQPGKPNSG